MSYMVDCEELIKAAKKSANLKLPESLECFNEASLPQIHWADSGELVDYSVIKYFILQSYKGKDAAPDPYLRNYLAAINHADRDSFAVYLLQGWIAIDTKPNSLEQARAKAYRDIGRYVEVDENSSWYQQLVDKYLQSCSHNAIKEKGVLGLVAACNSSRVVSIADKYLTEWYGQRASQCRALLQMLAWIDDPSALALLLSVSKRFRTSSIQTEAQLQIEQLTERKKWTFDEFADRTISTTDLDENNQLLLDYGKRKFIASLDGELNLILKDTDGKVIKSLPAPHKDEDKAKAGAAKKLLTDIKKQLKQLLDLQRDRLYESMCTQRSWRFADWQIYLNQHQLLRNYCRRLVWAVVDNNDQVLKTFRPLADGTLSDHQDNELRVDDNEKIKLAHTFTLSNEDCRAWLKHFSDYEVMPLFDQFTRDPYILPANHSSETVIKDFAGYRTIGYKLRDQAAKLGYTYGQKSSEGWITEFKKSYQSLKLEAVFRFTGAYLPQMDNYVYLLKLYFLEMDLTGKSDRQEVHRKLTEIPRVLLSETWNDLREIAARGEGFQPHWQQECHYVDTE